MFFASWMSRPGAPRGKARSRSKNTLVTFSAHRRLQRDMTWRKLVILGMLAGATVSQAAETPNPEVQRLELMFKFLDKDGDGNLTKAEAGNASWFSKLDPKGKGFISTEDFRTMLALVAKRGNLAGPRTLPGSPESATDVKDVSPREGPKQVKAAERNVGRLMPDVAFTDIHGKQGKLSDFKGSRALVIAFTSTSCPITKKLAPTLAVLEKEFAKQGVKFLFVNPTASDSAASITAMIKDQNFSGRYVHDRDSRVTAALGAGTTAEVFVLDAARTLLFRGAVDDQYGLGYSLEAPRHNYLKDALTAVLAGKPPLVASTEAPGCALEVKVATTKTDITYHNRVSRIIQNNCLECHRAGGVAPFGLETYDEVKSHAGMIRKQVEREAMPPWFAAPVKEATHSIWSNDRSLTAQDKRDLLAWIDSDKAIGNPAEAPLARVFPSGWQIGKPDLVLQLPRPIAIKATGVMPYQSVNVETTLTEDKWVKGYEIQPTAREVVHHVIVRVREASKGEKKGRDNVEERDGFFAAYVPGNDAAIFPEGFAKKLPAGSTINFQIHYTPAGKATTEQLKIGFIFAKEPPRHTIHVAGLANGLINIPPGAPNHMETASVTVPFDTTLLGLMPHFHLRGKAARYEALLPDGTKKLLLDVPRYDFNWQLKYEFAEPLTLPRGTTLLFSAWYDNSANNPANPDPTKTINWGQQTYDEMMLGYVEYYIPGQTTVAKAEKR